MRSWCALLLALALLAVPAMGEHAAAHGAPDTVRVGHIGVLSDAGIFVAIEKGYFSEQNIQVELHRFGDATAQVPLLAAEELDIGTGALGAELFNAIARGVPIRMVADEGALPPGFGFNVLVVRKDLVDSGRVKTPADLKGLTFGTESPAFAKERRDVAVRWMVAYLKGVHFYNGAFQDPAKKEELTRILMKYTPVQDPELYEHMIYPGLDPEGRVNADSVREQQQFWHERGLVPNPVPLQSVIDHSFVEEALEILGN